MVWHRIFHWLNSRYFVNDSKRTEYWAAMDVYGSYLFAWFAMGHFFLFITFAQMREKSKFKSNMMRTHIDWVDFQILYTNIKKKKMNKCFNYIIYGNLTRTKWTDDCADYFLFVCLFFHYYNFIIQISFFIFIDCSLEVFI